jgi:hypothetical protein
VSVWTEIDVKGRSLLIHKTLHCPYTLHITIKQHNIQAHTHTLPHHGHQLVDVGGVVRDPALCRVHVCVCVCVCVCNVCAYNIDTPIYISSLMQ